MYDMQDAPYVATPMTREFLDRANVYQPSSDPDQAAAETIALMCTYIKGSARDPLVQAEAQRAVDHYPSMLLSLASIAGDDPRLSLAAREQAAAEACWSWAKHNLQFVHHNKLFASWTPRFQEALQLLISPDVIAHALNGTDPEARARARMGDCAVYTPMIAALLECLGLDWELVIAKVPPRVQEFGHIWPRVVLSDGRRVDLDASHGPYPGWHVPAHDIYGIRVYNSNGRLVDEEVKALTGLGEYLSTGMGDCTTQYNDDGTSYQSCIDYGPSSSGTPSSGASPWASVIGNLANQWTAIGGRVIAPQTTYTVGPGGQVSYSTPGSAPVPGALPGSLGGSSSLLLIGGGVLGLVLLVSMMGKK